MIYSILFIPQGSFSMNNRLTIVKKHTLYINKNDFDGQENLFKCIAGSCLKSFKVAANEATLSVVPSVRRALVLFDAMLFALGLRPLESTLVFSMKRFEELQALFYGAICSDLFNDLTWPSRTGIAREFYKLLIRLSKKQNVRLLDFIPKSTQIQTDYKNLFEKQKFDDDAISLLQPYMLIDKHEVSYRVDLAEMKHTLGSNFTKIFFTALKEIAARKSKDYSLRDFGTHFSRYIGSNDFTYTLDSFKSRREVAKIILSYMMFHFSRYDCAKSLVPKTTLSSLQKRWSRYLIYFEFLFKANIMAKPLTPLPAGNPKLSTMNEVGHKRIVTNSTGTSEMITQKLITPVPLQLTDNEATELIFVQLKEDVSKVENWLDTVLDDLFENYEKGKFIALQSSVNSNDDFITSDFDHKHTTHALANAVHYYKVVHNGYCNTLASDNLVFPTRFASSLTKTEVHSLLGLPLRFHAQAFMARLIMLSPKITESALADANILDRHGKRINAVRIDNGISLSVSKDRNKGRWATTVFTGTEATLVTKWIKCTAPIRQYMRNNNIDGWQKLIVYTRTSLGAPAYFKRSSNMYSTFRSFAQKHANTLGHLSETITCSKLRSTVGVLVYLENKDLNQMAEALGNTSNTSLKHYLPDVLWEYFTERWIRIFQNLIIVDAMQDTKYLLPATDFDTIEELDNFIQNHSFHTPAPTNRPNSSTSTKVDGQLLINASLGIFSLLKNLSKAVISASDKGLKIHGLALYWHEFTKELEKHIVNDSYKDYSIKKLWSQAITDADLNRYMEVICIE